MGDPLREAIVSTVRELLTPANDVPAWRRIEAEAVRRGFSSTRAFRTWCLSRGVELREDNHKDTWVSPAAVDAAVQGLPVVAPRRLTPVDGQLDKEIDRDPSPRP